MRWAWGLVRQEGDLDRTRADCPSQAIFPINRKGNHRLRDITVSVSDV
jgi:hypothetical protein